jgi:hypothetical protein
MHIFSVFSLHLACLLQVRVKFMDKHKETFFEFFWQGFIRIQKTNLFNIESLEGSIQDITMARMDIFERGMHGNANINDYLFCNM